MANPDLSPSSNHSLSLVQALSPTLIEFWCGRRPHSEVEHKSHNSTAARPLTAGITNVTNVTNGHNGAQTSKNNNNNDNKDYSKRDEYPMSIGTPAADRLLGRTPNSQADDFSEKAPLSYPNPNLKMMFRAQG